MSTVQSRSPETVVKEIRRKTRRKFSVEELNKLLRAKVIERLEEGKGRSPAVYVFPSLLDIVKSREGSAGMWVSER
jgi:hypothetical protein